MALFKLEIATGNDAMQAREDVAAALAGVADATGIVWFLLSDPYVTAAWIEEDQ